MNTRSTPGRANRRDARARASRVADGLGRDGLERAGGKIAVGQDDLDAQRLEHAAPKREQLVHVERAHDPHRAPVGTRARRAAALEHPASAIGEQVGQAGGVTRRRLSPAPRAHRFPTVNEREAPPSENVLTMSLHAFGQRSHTRVS